MKTNKLEIEVTTLSESDESVHRQIKVEVEGNPDVLQEAIAETMQRNPQFKLFILEAVMEFIAEDRPESLDDAPKHIKKKFGKKKPDSDKIMGFGKGGEA